MRPSPQNRTLLTLAIAAPTVDEVRRIMQNAADQADAFELRMDAIDPARLDVAALLRDRPRPIVATNRPTWEGGQFEGSETQRLGLLAEAAALGAEHVDCEAKALHALDPAPFEKTKLIVSSHDFARMPDLRGAWDQCAESSRAHIVKTVGMAATVLDGLHALSVFGERTARPTISLAMGAPGVVSRILAPRYGAYLTFASLPQPGRETAPGQLSLDAMRHTYRATEITLKTTVVGLITQAASPHDACARFTQEVLSLGFDAVAVPIAPAGLPPESVLAACKKLGFQGMIIGGDSGSAWEHRGPLLRNDGEQWRPLPADAPLRLLVE